MAAVRACVLRGGCDEKAVGELPCLVFVERAACEVLHACVRHPEVKGRREGQHDANGRKRGVKAACVDVWMRVCAVPHNAQAETRMSVFTRSRTHHLQNSERKQSHTRCKKRNQQKRNQHFKRWWQSFNSRSTRVKPALDTHTYR